MQGGPNIAIKGAFRSGTNYLRFLLESNYECRCNYSAFGWKHGFVPIAGETAFSEVCAVPDCRHMIFPVKSPYAWLVSSFDYLCTTFRSMAASTDWTAFLRTAFVVFAGKRGYSAELMFPTPLDYWQCLHWNLRSSKAVIPHVAFVNYHDLIASPESTLNNAISHWGLIRNQNPFVDTDRSLLRASEHDVLPEMLGSDIFARDKYLSHTYLQRFADDDLAFINSRLNTELLAYLQCKPYHIGKAS